MSAVLVNMCMFIHSFVVGVGPRDKEFNGCQACM